MRTFLEEVVADVRHTHSTLSNLVFILPSKRAGTFLKQAIAASSTSPTLSPEIHSIESFVEKLSGLRQVSAPEQLFLLYQAFLSAKSPKEKERFYSFSKWAGSLLQDINEIDRYLINTQKLFANLAEVQEINHWSLQAEKTGMMEAHVQFWNSLGELYTHFNQGLLKKGLGHQGLLYRCAHERVDDYLNQNPERSHVFIGFNALNKAESEIIQSFLCRPTNHIYWDLDARFLEDPHHDAGYFIRNHLKRWRYFQNNGPKGIKKKAEVKKDIQIIRVPTPVAQAKYIGNLLKDLDKKDKASLRTTAVVLGDEGLLNPLLHALPQEISTVNITMGYPLGKSIMASLFSQLFGLHVHKTERGWYHKEVLELLAHPHIQILWTTKQGHNVARFLSQHVREKNWIYLTPLRLKKALDWNKNPISPLFWESPTPKRFVAHCVTIITRLKEKLGSHGDALSLEYLYRFHTIFNQLQTLLDTYSFIDDLNALKRVFDELLSTETLDFSGEPLEGLQVMGMLESRNLDFETVILASVNEGILPLGKTNTSHIPFDLKVHYGLPTYKDKDAVYTYHFYRLLQRAKRIFVLYVTQTDGLQGGEKSRLVQQLLTDKSLTGQITEKTVVPRLRASPKTPTSFKKTRDILERLRHRAARGFSPTSLTNYIRNPIDFYTQNLLQLNDIQEVEENMAPNTFGTIIHDVLESLYKPYVGGYLAESTLQEAKRKVEKCVRHHFERSYPGSDLSTGKNRIAFQVILKYIHNFLDTEIGELKQHRIKIIGLETQFESPLDIPELDYPVVLKGKLDRIDEKDGTIRIIDYKTGTTTPAQVEIWDWDTLTANYDHSKAFQLLCYALLYSTKTSFQGIEASILPIKNLNNGPFSFALKPTKNSRKKDKIVTHEVLNTFKVQLKKLILEICNPEIPFIEKEV
ncbi:MAG: PD-(D/E)XK nuclease family protein [Bacteroidota bacterium]